MGRPNWPKFSVQAGPNGSIPAPAGAKKFEEKTMEASENAGRSREGGGMPGVQRIDLDHVRASLGRGAAMAGYHRLSLMLGTIIPRLTEEPGRAKRD
jgi:hypothetical protein